MIGEGRPIRTNPWAFHLRDSIVFYVTHPCGRRTPQDYGPKFEDSVNFRAILFDLRSLCVYNSIYRNLCHRLERGKEIALEGLTYLKSILLGIIQGLTEFLPVSSSAHITLFTEIFGIKIGEELLEAFIVMLHLGTLLAVLICYIKRVFSLFAHPISGELKWLILATLPTVAYALILKFTGWDEVIASCARYLLPFAFLFTALILLLADGIGKARHEAKTTHKYVRFRDALSMGLMQCVGTFTGVSRSGSTIAGGLASGLTRKSAADFAFMMSIPAILGAAVLDGWKLIKGGQLTETLSGDLPMILAGIAAALVSGLLAIRLMLAVIRKSKLKWFSLYLALLAALVFANEYIHIW